QAIFGVYADFARLLLHLVQHGCGGPEPSPVLRVATRFEEGHFVLQVEDQGGPIPDVLLAHAFEPFSELHQQPVMGIRSPGPGLPHARQLLEPYSGIITLANEGEGTRVMVRIPLGA
ncbi:MAG TPA: ATP-binding protein, partial [Holophaga sp.]|nr:ATP-binding protein [Holophaga sp.]